MNILFKRKIVLITGWASGIGKACCDLFLAGKARVIVLDLAGAEEVANLAYFLASKKASFITGHEYRVDGGIGIKIPGS